MDKEEFKKAVLPLSEKMFRFAYRLLKDTELSRDCVQESFVKLWENRKKIDAVENISAYAFTIVRNNCIDKIRKMKLAGEFGKNSALQVSTVENNFELSESRVLVEKLIQDLPSQQKLIIEMRDIEEFSYEEIAESLDITVNNVRVQLSLARKKIKDELIKIYNYGLAKD